MLLHFEDEREEEEALSFSNLPITKFIEEDVKVDKGGSNEDDIDFDFDFEFGSEMCPADEVISGGQLLPFRHSVSSETVVARAQNSNPRTVSRSESMDRTGFYSRNSSSRSSSIRSQYSSTSSTSTSSNNTSNSVKTVPISRNRGKNNYFHSHPSPRPRVWASGARGPNTINCATPVPKKSTMWDVLRLGLVRTPEIELQDLKQRHRLSNSGKTAFILPRNNSFDGNNNTTNNSSNNNNNINNDDNKGKMSDFLIELEKKKSGGFFKSCKCSVMAIEPMHTREFGPKNNKFLPNYHQIIKEDKEIAQKKVTQQQQHKLKKEQSRQGKKVVSHHHRTFEWLRDLSHVNVLRVGLL